MKCQRRKCGSEANPTGPKLREIASGKDLIFCCLLCRSLFMNCRGQLKKYRPLMN